MNTKLSLSNTEIAFKSKNNSVLRQSAWLFKLMGSPVLVKLFSNGTLLALKLRLPISAILKATIYKQFCAGETIEESQKVVANLNHSRVNSILDYSVESKNNQSDFELTKDEVLKIINIARSNPAIPYTSLKLTGIVNASILETLNNKSIIDGNTMPEYVVFRKHLEEICTSASQAEVPIYIDAEESWFQSTIDRITEEMMCRFNTKKAIVLTTLQMYRKDRIHYLNYLIDRARKENFYLGIKLVRGAYLEKEDLRAEQLCYESPIHNTKEATDFDFDLAVDICLQNIDIITLCAGTHNESSTMHLIHKMEELHLKNDHSNIYFSQLYGMSDHITFNIAAQGYNVTKYLPYGPVKSTIPYLIRRAQENTAIAGQMSRELKLIIEEKKRRSCQKLLA